MRSRAPFQLRQSRVLSALTLIGVMLLGTTDMSCCTEVGCGPSFSLNAPLPVPFEAVKALTAEVCRNGQCISGSLAGLVQPSANTGSGVRLWPVTVSEEGPTVFVLLDGSENLRFQMDYFNGNLVSGDVFTVRLTNPSGANVFTFERAMTMPNVNKPNGEFCGPTCSSASVRLD